MVCKTCGPKRKSDVSPWVTTFYRGFAQKPSKVEVLDGLNGAADGLLHKGISKYESASLIVFNIGFA